MADLALVRAVPNSFARALVSSAARPEIDVGLARRQHRQYVDLLAAAGYRLQWVPSDEHHPDCVFVEDTAVIVGDTAVMCRSGAASRRGEAGPVRRALPRHLTIRDIEPPGTLDGGDVFTLAKRLFVGRSRRTNQAGLDQLAGIAADEGLETTVVAVGDALHLKSAVLPIDEQTVLVTPNAVDETALSGLRLIYEVTDERHLASALPLRNGRVAVTASAPATADRLTTAGHAVVPIDVSQLQAADGGLTCLSILI